jgi:hypothetical protein
MVFLAKAANAENKLRKTNKCKNKINYKNTLKGKNNQTKTWKCISINIEECASKCTDQIPPRLNFCTPSKFLNKIKKTQIHH